jgi:uncharacterized protein YutE (UPF0331/DUF86 family)
MTDPALVLAKLTILREHARRVEQRRPDTVEAFRHDVDRQDALALSLMVALQQASDVALHIAADEGWGIASSYAESFGLLATHGAISGALATRLSDIASLRNRIAHGYVTVDFERIWREVPAGVAALREFASAVAAYLSPGH